MTGGRLSNLLARSITGESVLLVALIVQLLLPSVSRVLPSARWFLLIAWLLMMGCLLVVALMNVRLVGMALVALGVALNMTVIALNGAMPVSLPAITAADPDVAIHSVKFDALHEPLSDQTLLPLIADTIAVPGPKWHRGIVSVGDIVLVIGLGLFVFSGTRRVDVA
ncbi:MAG: DUF5317 family protein [Coriobacteriia bacterium]|nr:DUF5317 family protein [Coriobacteriia bacterium]